MPIICNYIENNDWRDVPGWEGYYQANRDGQIRSVDRMITRKPNVRYVIKGRIRKQGFCQIAGHLPRLNINFSKNNITKTTWSHIIIARTFIPNPENLPQVNHKDGNPLNNHCDNLEWCDNYSNMIHAVANNLVTKAIGHNNGKSKLSSREAVEIFNSKLTHKHLRQRYNVSGRTISDIKSRQSWAASNGVKRKNKILNEADVIDIFSRNKSTKELCDKYQVSKHVIYKIWYKINYSHITNKLG